MTRLRALPFILFVVVACGRKQSTANPTSSANPIATANPTANSTALTEPKRGCELMMQRGMGSFRLSSSDAGARVATGDPIPNGSFVDLAEGAEVTIRTAHNREITISGPASATLCPDGEDGVFLSRGRLSAFPGTGVRPGADVWVATPLGVVRYDDAKIDLDAPKGDGTRLMVTASMASAELIAAPGVELRSENGGDAGPASPFAEVPLAAGATLVAERPAAPLARLVRELVGACTKESDGAREAARRLSDGPEAGPLGERASAHVRARRRARAACETARAAAGLGPGALDGSLAAELAAADEKRNQLTPLPARR